MAQAAGETLHYDQHTEGGWSWERHSASQVIQPIGSFRIFLSTNQRLHIWLTAHDNALWPAYRRRMVLERHVASEVIQPIGSFMPFNQSEASVLLTTCKNALWPAYRRRLVLGEACGISGKPANRKLYTFLSTNQKLFLVTTYKNALWPAYRRRWALGKASKEKYLSFDLFKAFY